MRAVSEVYRIFSEKMPEHAIEANQLLHDILTDLAIKTVCKVRVINRYDVSGLSGREYAMARNVVFSEPPVDIAYDETVDLEDACYILAVEALPGQYDQRADSAAQCVQILTQKEKPLVRTARVYAFYGSLTNDQKEEISKFLINPVEARKASLKKPDTLTDELFSPDDITDIEGFLDMSVDDLRDLIISLGLAMSVDDIVFTQKYFAGISRVPTTTEIRVLDTYWSDHCRHTTFLTELTNVSVNGDSEIASDIFQTYNDYLISRKNIYGDHADKKPICLMDVATMAMKKLKSEGKLSDLDESEEINACSIKVKVNIDGTDEEYLLMFKNETHNHPTEIEPFGGAATCLGGAIRDPLSGRSYVYHAMRVTGAGDPTVPVSETIPGKLSQKRLVRTAAAGYSSYGNQIGLATGYVDEIYHPGYVAKRMEIGAVVGAAPASAVIRERPKAKDIVILLGGRTGRDGIGGATGSSKVHDETSVLTCGAEVQKGNPPTERKIQRLFRNPEVSRLILRCNDFGAGGVCVAIGELSDGIEIDLDKVPKKYEGLDGTELAISESQERMAVLIDPKEKELFLKYAAEENLEAVQVAVVTEKPNMIMKWRGKTIVDLPRSFINTNGARSYASVSIDPPDMNHAYPDSLLSTAVKGDFVRSLGQSLRSLESCSRKGLVQRFDSTIGASTVLMPFGGKYQSSPEEGMVAKIPVLNGQTDTVSVMAYGFDPYLSEWSPYHGAYYAVVESLLRLAAMGADPRKARLTFQEYFERLTDSASWGKPLSALLGAYRAQIDYGTPSIGGKDSMSGTFNDIHVPPTLVSFAVATASSKNIVSSCLNCAGQKLYAISLSKDNLHIFKKAQVLRVFKALVQMNERGQIFASSVVRGGGIASRTVQMCLGNNLGFAFCDSWTIDELFSRSFCTILISVRDGNAVEKIEMLGGRLVGRSNNSQAITWNEQTIALKDAQSAFDSTLESIFPTYTKEKSKGTVECPPCDKIAVRKFPEIQKGIRPKVFIPVFPGTNTEYDTVKSFENAGADTDVFVIRNLTSADITESLSEMCIRIKRAQIIMLPGGFSGGDEPEGSAKFIVAALKNPSVSEAVRDLLFKRDGLMLGICNGFQALLKLGLLPYGDILPSKTDSPSLTFNQIGRHQSVYVSTKIVSVLSPWLQLSQVGQIHHVPVSHGEGRFVASPESLSQLFSSGCIATQYVDEAGSPSMDTRYNPNGSICSVEGILSPDGRIFGKMGHSERYGSDVAINIPGDKDQKIFESGVRYFLG